MHIEQGLTYPPGVKVYNGKVSFTTIVPEGAECNLILYKKGTDVPEMRIPLEAENAKGVMRSVAVYDLDSRAYDYNYEIDGKVTIDPYVRELTGHMQFGKMEDIQSHKVRGIVQYDEYNWEDDKKPYIPYNDVIAYSLHVRGFTNDTGSKVKHKGTFKGVEEKIPYLKDLGINQIQCMPVYEFEEMSGLKTNYWGYGKAYYYAPKASYAGKKGPVRELKDMIKACHKNGIEVVLEMPFGEEIIPQSVIECLRYYMLEYHVDGFVVNPYRIPWNMTINDPYLKGVKILRKEEEFQNTMRRFLKGDEAMVPDVIRNLKHQAVKDGCFNYITAQTGFTLKDLVSYDGKHNDANGEKNEDGPSYNYSWNCGVEGTTRKKCVTDLRKNQMLNAFVLLLMAQGTPCILSGDEFANSQSGNNNVYCQDNELSWVNWNRKKNREELYQFVKDLISYRKAHKVLHREKELTGTDTSACGMPDVSYHGDNAWVTPDYVASRQLGVLYSGKDVDDTDIYIAYNMHWEEHDFALPSVKDNKEWHIVLNTASGSSFTDEKCTDDKKVTASPRSIIILERKAVAVKKAELKHKQKRKCNDICNEHKKSEEEKEINETKDKNENDYPVKKDTRKKEEDK